MAKRLSAAAKQANIEHARRNAYREQEAQYLRIVGNAARDIHQAMYRDHRPFYLYHLPSTATEYGRLIHVPERGDPPAGNWQLAETERIPRTLTEAQLGSWIRTRAHRLPMYPDLPQGAIRPAEAP